MITNDEARRKLRIEWDGVIAMRKRMQTLVVVTFAGGALTGPALRKVVYNLPLLLAFDVLRQVLREGKGEGEGEGEGAFTCPSGQLGGLMKCAGHSVPWLDWAALYDGVQRRNEVAHDGKLHDGLTCMADIDNVEAQLMMWGVITSG